MTEDPTDKKLLAGEPTNKNLPNDPFTALIQYLSNLKPDEQVVAAIPLIVFVLTISNIAQLPLEKQWSAYLLSFFIAVVAWLFLLGKVVYKMKKQNGAVTQDKKQLAEERDRLVIAWDARYTQMENLREKAEKLQQSLGFIVQEGRLEADNDAVLKADLLVREIEIHLKETNCRVLEMRQAQEVVKTPEENLKILQRVKQDTNSEAPED